MVCNALRKELTEILTLLPEGRKPALRRSLREEWLYATDVPVISGGDVPAALRKAGADLQGFMKTVIKLPCPACYTDKNAA